MGGEHGCRDMDGYCVGEPGTRWLSTRASGSRPSPARHLGPTTPEKALVVNEQFATTKQDVLEDVMAAVLKASKCSTCAANRTKAASVLGVPST